MSAARSASIVIERAAPMGGSHSPDEPEARWLRASVALVAAAAAAMKIDTLL